MCIRRTAVVTGVSRQYHEFVSHDTGVIAKLTGVNAFRLDVDGEVTDGRSFELPVFLAHMLHHERRLAGSSSDEAPAALWVATGEVDADHRVNRVDGIDKKLQVLGAWLAGAPPDLPPVRLLLPAANRSDVESLPESITARNVQVQFVERADEPGAPKERPSGWLRRLVPAAATVSALLLLVVAGFTVAQREALVPAGAASGAAADVIDSDILVRDVHSSTEQCYGPERRSTTHSVRLGGEIVLPSDVSRCRMEVVASSRSGLPPRAYLLARNGTAVEPVDLGVRGSLGPALTRDTTVLQVGFSQRPLRGNESVTLPGIVIRLSP